MTINNKTYIQTPRKPFIYSPYGSDYYRINCPGCGYTFGYYPKIENCQWNDCPSCGCPLDWSELRDDENCDGEAGGLEWTGKRNTGKDVPYELKIRWHKNLKGGENDRANGQ